MAENTNGASERRLDIMATLCIAWSQPLIRAVALMELTAITKPRVVELS